MTPKEAALKLGCVVSTVKKWIRDGTMKASKSAIPGGGYAYKISEAEVNRVSRLPKPSVGCPRGTKKGG